MVTDWICFVCGDDNHISESVCKNCGAERPLAVQGFSSFEDSSNYAENAFDHFSSESLPETIKVKDVLHSLQNCLNRAVSSSVDSEKFKFMLAPILEIWEALYTRADDFITELDDKHLAERIKIRQSDSYFIFKLAAMQFEMYSPENIQPVRIGMMLSKIAGEGLDWLLSFAQSRQFPDEASRDLIAAPIDAYLKGELDADSYFDAICNADDFLGDCLDDGICSFHEAINEAKKFDGQTYTLLLNTREAASEANEKWVKAIVATHSDLPLPAVEGAY
ncbi:MAG: hypothetical protein ACI376_06630 [Candidatus Bruticola sp.]